MAFDIRSTEEEEDSQPEGDSNEEPTCPFRGESTPPNISLKCGTIEVGITSPYMDLEDIIPLAKDLFLFVLNHSREKTGESTYG